MSGGQQRKRIGEFMMEKGLIHKEWIPPILDHAKANQIRFGEAAVAAIRDLVRECDAADSEWRIAHCRGGVPRIFRSVDAGNHCTVCTHVEYAVRQLSLQLVQRLRLTARAVLEIHQRPIAAGQAPF